MEQITYGASSGIFKIEKPTILKCPFPGFEDDLRCEQRAYELLGRHPRIAHYYGRFNNVGCELEYYRNGCIDKIMTTMHGELPYLKWAEQIAEALVFMHSKGIIHCDLRTPNILVTDIAPADFASCCIDGVKVSTVTNIARYRPPSWENYKECKVSLQNDFFVFGSVVYFLITHEAPYKDLEDHEAIKLYTVGKFPDVSRWPLGTVMNKCWRGEYSTTSHLLKDIHQCTSLPLHLKWWFADMFFSYRSCEIRITF
ncbi:TKL protein kinase [Blastomyces dermatitidis ATCC 18188]|uniref:TKL protein kinase n=1 Tax=Ajellomyces dermatitidis (strain ATCC 18188 / CBS 674.68) TaxID=653446 RepID=F2T8A7_AJEDA|nr:TKL protein kinase [Blastomyces dermatitidis ATCC 18188]